MKNNRIKTKERALEIPTLARYILSVHHYVTVFFSRLVDITPLITHKGELRNQLFYVEQTVNQHLMALPALIYDHVQEITAKIYQKNVH